MAGATALGLSRELRTQPIGNRPRTSRRGQVEHKPVATSLASARPPFDQLTHYVRPRVATWLYTQPDISGQIRRLRQNTSSAGSAGAIPAGQRATDASLRARLTATLDRNKQLADENARLRRQLARALGDQRSARTRSGNDPQG